ncbi:hypothetical protein EYF80_045934 [Liparis tanakae]|uniref:Uncharacterized protein n=1 Tax=Liparis tanakae TaxID=230148 RepID=A0A4Z2FSM4_9TELE|nr:hypothetical protein EYF80_045934 [Liparis tanakae]
MVSPIGVAVTVEDRTGMERRGGGSTAATPLHTAGKGRRSRLDAAPFLAQVEKPLSCPPLIELSGRVDARRASGGGGVTGILGGLVGVRGQFSTPSLALCAGGARRATLSQQDDLTHL